MRIYFTFFILLLNLCPLSLFGDINFNVHTSQDTLPKSGNISIRGIVIDKETQKPLPFCNVFIANTLKGTKTNEDGTYIIKNLEPGQVLVMASFVGYQTVSKRLILEDDLDIVLDLLLSPSREKLDEVQVKGEKDKKWERQYNRFKKVFLGETSNSKYTKILNPWVLDFEVKKGVFKAFSNTPLEIENRALGYKLSYYLNEFELKKDASKYYGHVKYELLEAENIEEATRWIKNRETSYKGSLMHFFKSLIHKKLDEEGFLAFEYNEAHPEIQGHLTPNIGMALTPIIADSVVKNTVLPNYKTINLKKRVTILYRNKFNYSSPYKDAPYPVSYLKIKFPFFMVNTNGYVNNPLAVEISGYLLTNGVADYLPYDYDPESEDQREIYASLQDDEIMKNLQEQYNEVLFQFPNQNLFLSFDKPYYASGDDIWFNSFLLYYNSKNLIPGIYTMHVDLISPDDKIIQTLTLPVIEGLSPGNFSNTSILPTGKYSIRAYTNEMQSFGKNYFFEQSIDIFNPSEISKLQDEIETDTNGVDVQFFPEGGHMVYGLLSTIGFKSLGQNGKGKAIKGYVVDDFRNKVAEFQSNHLGIGSFQLKPVPGRVYIAKVEIDNELRSFPLPKILNQGSVLTVENKDPDFIKVKIQNSSRTTKEDFYLIGQSREIILFKSRGRFKEKAIEFKIPKTELPEGVFQLTLFDKVGIPHCERLVYISHGIGNMNIDVEPDKSHYSKRELVEMKISVMDAFNDPVEGIASVSVVDASIINKDNFSENIQTQLLLSADLKGHIESPGYYFHRQTLSVLHDLDLLMLTQGWRRYNWDHILKQDLKMPELTIENGLTLTGTIKSKNKPVNEAQILLVPQSKVWAPYIVIKADKKGRFSIPNVEVFDTTKILINTMNANGFNIDANIEFDNFLQPKVSNTFRKDKINMDTPLIRKFMQKSMLISQIDSIYNFEGMTLLEDVEVKGKKIKEEPPRDLSVLHGDPDLSFENFGDRFSGYPNVLKALENRYRMRGPGSISGQINSEGAAVGGNNDPLYLLDGVYIDKDELVNIHPQEVERVDIIKEGASTVIYGARGATGVISIILKKGHNFKDKKPIGVGIYTLPAYNVSKEFYAPKYEIQDEEYSVPDVRTTLYWNPKVNLDINGRTKINFYNSDDTSRFQVVIQGISDDGKPFFKIWTSGGEQ